MATMYMGQYLINSFHAVNEATGIEIPADEEGYISLTAGDTVVFKSIYNGRNVNVNTIVFFSKNAPLKLALNDNTMYPFYVSAGAKRGIESMRIYSFTALEDCELYYEGIVTE